MDRSQKRLFVVNLLMVLVGFGISLYLTVEHFSVLKSGITERSICNVSSYFNCDVVLNSKYATLATLPLAGLALAYYFYLLVSLLIFWVAPENPRRILGLPYLTTLMSIAASAVLAYISFAKLGTFCLFCSGLYLVNLILLVAMKKLSRFSWSDLSESLGRIAWLKLLPVLAACFLFGALFLHNSTRSYAKEPPEEKIRQYLRFFFAQPAQQFNTEGKVYWGNPNAKIVFVEFSDFECPMCKLAALNLKPWLADYREQIKFVFLNFPLDKSCNSLLPEEKHRQACSVAYSAYCAGQQGKFWEFHDAAFDRQPRFSPENLQNIAKKVGLDMNAYQSCIGAEPTKSAISDDIQQGIKAQIPGTPGIFVNGRPFEAWSSRTVVNKMIEAYASGDPQRLYPPPTPPPQIKGSPESQ